MLKIGVVGCGYWGPNLIRNFLQLHNTRVSCCDFSEERLKQMKSLFFDVDTFKSYEKLLSSDIDAVTVATPVASHFELAKKAILKGKHVLIEKPITKTSREALELIKLASKNKVTLMVDHTFEYAPSIKKIREIVKNGELGDIYTFNTTRVNLGLFQKDVNVLLDLAPHDISILRYVLEQEPVSVRAFAHSFINSNIQDTAYLFLQFKNNIMAHLHLSWLSPRKIRELTIIGSKKMLVYDDVQSNEKIKIYDKGVSLAKQELPPTKYYTSYAEFQFFYRSGDIFIPKVDDVEPLKEVCKHFIDCINTGKKPMTDGNSGYNVIKVIDAAQKSLQKNGNEVKI